MAAVDDSLAPLQAAITAIEAQRALLGDAVADAALGPLRERLALLRAGATRPAADEPQLRHCAILFLDVVGSTALSRQLDPEEIQAVMDGALARFTACVQDHGGRVLQYAGDSLLAVWGAAASQEDDTERAVLAGLALLALGREEGAAVARRHGHTGFDVRVGLHYGPVLLGGGVNAEASIRGLAVNVAARMEQTAPSGALRISHEVWRLVRGRFEAQEQPPLQVKGVEGAVASWLVQRALPASLAGPQRGIEGLATPLIGRQEELQALHAAWARVQHRSGPELHLLLGEPGLGKSRLLAEFERLARPAAHTVLRSRSQPQHGLHPYGLLRELLFAQAGIGEDTTAEQARERLVRMLAGPLAERAERAERAEESAALLGQLVGLDCSHSPHVAGLLNDGKQLRSRAFQAALAWLQGLAAVGPLLVLLDDLHWADDGSLDFVERLHALPATQPLLVLALARPALLERRAAWGQSHERWQATPLQALGPAQRLALADALLAKLPHPPAPLRELLADRADGNPFFMEELLQMLIDRGLVQRGSGPDAPWTVATDRLADLQVPTTLVAVLQARLDGLTPPERRSVQQASVIGALFWDQALAALDPAAPATLHALCTREVTIERATSRFEGTHEYAFRHHLLQQVSYDGVLKRDRQHHHHATALWLQQRAGARSGEHLGLIAHHFERAGEAAPAAHWWTLAAEAAAARDADEAALTAVQRAQSLDAGHDDDAARRRAIALTGVLEGVAEHRADLRTQDEATQRMLQLAQALGDDIQQAHAQLRRAWWLVRQGQAQEGLALAEQAVALALQGQEPSARIAARAHNVAMNALIYLTRPGQAREHGLAGLPLARQAGDADTEGKLLNGIGVTWQIEQRVARALPWHRESLQAFARGGSRWASMTSGANAAVCLLELGLMEEACEQLRANVALSIEAGNTTNEAMARGSLARALVELGDLAAAGEQVQAALVLAAGNVRSESFVCMAHAHWLLNAGRYDEAIGESRRAERVYRELGAVGNAVGAALFAADALAALGRHAEAAALALALRDEADQAGVCQQEYVLEWACFTTAQALGEARAQQHLAQAHARLLALAEQVEDPALRQRYLAGMADRRALRAAYARSMRA